MTDAEMSRILQDFAQAHTLAKDVRVEITEHSKLFTATSEEGAKYEDIVLLGEIVRGAEHFLMWARRTGRVRFRHLKRAKGIRK